MTEDRPASSYWLTTCDCALATLNAMHYQKFGTDAIRFKWPSLATGFKGSVSDPKRGQKVPKWAVNLGFLIWAAALFVPPFSARAQPAEPSAQEIINQLSKPVTRSLTRSLTRNLVAEPKPSVSLLVQFDFDSANVRPESQQVLQNLAEALRSHALRDAKFAVEGHTDAKGAVEYNRKLSLARAEAVAKFLSAREVDSARLLPSGKGSSDLANPASPFAAENRRVKIVNLE